VLASDEVPLIVQRYGMGSCREDRPRQVPTPRTDPLVEDVMPGCGDPGIEHPPLMMITNG
jgi:hypothetical protein